jgi:hypothetical protein
MCVHCGELFPEYCQVAKGRLKSESLAVGQERNTYKVVCRQKTIQPTAIALRSCLAVDKTRDKSLAFEKSKTGNFARF